MSRNASVRIGTSGWTYASWRGPFYSEDAPQRRWLQDYSSVFTTTEINTSFYRTPSVEAVRAWHDATGDDFSFAWKASKFITHWKRLSDKSANSLELMESRLAVLGRKVGPILFQLPARFKADRARLTSFIKLLSKKRLYAFEFRDPSWYEADILDVLRRSGIALCLSDHHEAPAPWEVTAQHIYVRGHGPTGKYHGNYADSTLRKWARNFRQWQQQGHSIYCYFDNDQKSAAPHDGASLMRLMAKRTKRTGSSSLALHR